jgi:Secretion system C-terminal sorting domain
MKKIISLFFMSVTALSINAQTVVYNGPEVLLPNSKENYSTVKLPQGVTVNWSIVGGQIQGATTNALVFYNATTTTVILTAKLSNNTMISDTLPIVDKGANLVEGDITMVTGNRQYTITQLLRGQRVKIKPINFTGVNPKLTLLSSQGRIIQRGDSIDFRSPTRGLFYILVNAQSNGQLRVQGISPNVFEPEIIRVSPLTQPNCTVRNLDFQVDSKANYTGGESMVKLDNKIITAVYDFVLNKTVINAYQNDQLVWTWLSNDNEYIRTLNVHPSFGIVGIGSSGGALRSEDNVLVIKVSGNGMLQTRTIFGTTDGRDFGFGVSFLDDGSIMGTGFTEGSFPTFTNAGQLDAFAVRISATGVILNTLQYGTTKDDRIFASATLNNGNVLIFGDSEGKIGDTWTPLGSYDIFITEITPACVRIKNTQYGTAENDIAFDVVIEPVSGDIFITGMTTGEMASGSGNPLRPQVYTARINNTTHGIVWLKQLGVNEGQSGESLALASTGVGVIFYTFGSLNGANNNSLGTPASDDMVVALYDFNGNLNTLYQFDQTLERIFARAIAFEIDNIFVLRDHVYELGKPFITTSLDRFTNPLITTGIKDVTVKNSISIFPNPTSYEINILFTPTNYFTTEIINTLGETVLQSQNQNRIDVSQLAKGIYILKATYNKKIYTQKIIIQ